MGKLLSFIVFAAFAVGAVINYHNTTAKQALLKLSTSKERIMYRKNVFKRRIKIICEVVIFPIICLCFTWAWLMVDDYFISNKPTHDYKMWLGMFFFILAIIIIIAVPFGIIMFMQYKGNLSYYDKDTFLRSCLKMDKKELNGR